jgi:outer membrane protein OmpA-like peptidoglycan-associated protein
VTAQDTANNVIAAPAVQWTSSDASVVSVSASGLVTAVRNGTATITAAIPGGPSATAAVTVKQTTAAVTVSPPAATLSAVGATVRLAVQASDANGRPVGGKVITWADSAPGVATLGPGGVVSAVANGTTRISATVEGVTGSALVTVALPAAPPAPAVALPVVGAAPVVLRTVAFRPNSAVLPAEAFDELDAVARAILAIPGSRWEIGGYTSNMGNAARNQTLSRRRALAVRAYLIRQGVPAARLTAVGYGPDNPIASNATVAGRRANMRVELKRLR